MSRSTVPLTPVQRQGLAWLLLGGAAALLPLGRELPWWAVAAFAGLLCWRLGIDRRGWPAPGRLLRVALAAFGVALVYARYGSFLGRDPGIALLVWLTGTKALELTDERDAMLWAFLLFLLLLGGFLYDQSPLHAFYALVVVVLVVAGMMRLHEDRPLTPVARFRYAAVVVVQALPLMLLMYVLFPRLPAPLWSLPNPSRAALTGMSDEMRPGSIGELVASGAIAFRVHFDGARPATTDRYWRVRVLWDTDGRVWRTGASYDESPGFEPLGDPVAYRVMLEPTGKTWLPALDMPVIAPANTRIRSGRVLERHQPVNERVVYVLRSHPRHRTGPLPAWERRRALAVPPTSERVRALARSWRQAAEGDDDVVRAALQYFRKESFRYTLSPPRLGDDPVDEFLFETRRGFCEHYAAAFATLMRAAGVATRVVIGYQGGLYNPTGDYDMVRQSDAHAWTEVWLAPRGWVRVDATAAVAPERVEQGIESVVAEGAEARAGEPARFEARWLARAWQRARFTWDYVNLSWFYWVKDYDENRQTRLLDRLGLRDSAGLVLVAGVMGLVLAYALGAGRRRRPGDPLARIYDRYCRKLARAGLARDPHEGPLDYARRAAARWPEQRAAIVAITSRYVSFRYGSAQASPRERTALARAVRRLAVPRAR
ncbi:transglutaminase [Sulfurifustis variabilis]|uniref:Transglutaminase n=1 Tax=Sulfurifustis variabilis TaxID=1675686 RepID=A0A1C7AG45_9GAMM|nr:DUF3488 and transglutaminase-like domain-containing protein [Sulfurifustis variabilis]BAU50443.1 transglutaminase [Sulfurifustis variabilis]